MRTQVSPWSTPLIQRSWKVAWDETWVADRAAARARMVDLIVAVDGRCVVRGKKRLGLGIPRFISFVLSTRPLDKAFSLPPFIQAIRNALSSSVEGES